MNSSLLEGLRDRESRQIDSPRKAFWALDPYDIEHQPHPYSLKEVMAFLGGSFSETTPIFISGPQDLGLFSVNEKIQEFLKKFSVGHFQDVQILKTESTQKSVWADLLLRSAVAGRAEILILSSHGKKGLSKLLVGSLAEVLLQSSPLPLFLLSSKPVSRKKKVMFLTDFTDDSYRAFLELIALMEGTGYDLILLHAVFLPSSSIGTALTASEHPNSLVSPEPASHSQWAYAQSQKWIERVKRMGTGVSIRAVVEEALNPPSSAILQFAENENVGLIALSASGKSSGAFLNGGVEKEILDADQFNVWVCGPRAGNFASFSTNAPETIS